VKVSWRPAPRIGGAIAERERPERFEIRVNDIEDPLPDVTFGSIGRYVEVARPDGLDEPFEPQRLVLGFDEKQAEHVDLWSLTLFGVELESRSFTPVESSRVDVDEHEVTAWVDQPGIYGLIGLPKHPAVLETLRLLDRYSPQLFEERERGEHGLQDRVCGLILCEDPTKWGGGPIGPGDLCAKCLGLDVSYPRLPERLLLEPQVPVRAFPPHLDKPPPPPPGTPTILAWGSNFFGDLGDGTTVLRRTPVFVAGLNAKKVVGGGGTTIALSPDGTVWSWGRNDVGQLGDGTTTNRSTPGRVANLTGVVDIAVGQYHALAARSDGSVVTWGRDVALGNFNLVPVQVPGLSDVIAVAAGEEFDLALTRFERVLSWGLNSSGQLGDGSRVGRTNPALVPGLTSVASIAAGQESSFAVKVTGDVVAWGSGYGGILGDGGQMDRLTPVPVPNLSYVQQVSARRHGMARDTAGDVWVWGMGVDGENGDGTTTNHLTPVRVPGLQQAPILAVAAGEFHSLAVYGSRVLAWGRDVDGQVGDGGMADRLTPFTVPLPAGRRAVGVGAGPGWSFAMLG
jgi:alpha-tubulin suppressor-like RCC1 family protein